ncbi:MAG: LLM class flavin-dependent oxidoreductase [Proteobacteria bacterium]|nr:LLM class flavin-dependent oxidoreductase [Pseudomonadota bacterium]
MKLGYFTMPMHPPERDYTQTLREDREAIVLADQLGYAEAFIGEHFADTSETIPSCLSFIASLAHATKTIRLGSGTVNLPNHHPAALAGHVAMIDHLLEGRFIFGIGPGGQRADMEIMGNLDADRGAMFLESIDHILALWSGEPPYDRSGRFWNISSRRTLMADIGQGVFLKPFQKPHPPIVVTAIMPGAKGLAAACARGWWPISANFLQGTLVGSHWPGIAAGFAKGGHAVDWRHWRIARSIFVAEDDASAERYVREARDAYRYYFHNLLAKRRLGGFLGSFKHDPDMPDAAVSVDYLLDTMVIKGSPARVADEILALREKTGPFGTLLYCGHDWADVPRARRSMELMAEAVMPRVNAALGESA